MKTIVRISILCALAISSQAKSNDSNCPELMSARNINAVQTICTKQAAGDDIEKSKCITSRLMEQISNAQTTGKINGNVIKKENLTYCKQLVLDLFSR